MMKYTSTPIQVSVFLLLFCTFLSCTKDSDLFADVIVNESISNIENASSNSNSAEESNVTVNLVNGSIETNEDVIAVFNISDLSTNTSGKSIELKNVEQPVNGVVEIEKDTIIRYIPNSDFNGIDNITYTIELVNEDNSISQEETTLEINVKPVTDVVNDDVSISGSNEVIIPVLNNDTFSNKDNAAISDTTEPTKGTVIVRADKSISYSPYANAVGPDSFDYEVETTNEDGSTSSEVGTVNVTIASASNPGDTDMGELKAFPGAEGFGKYTTGGRGGSIIKVTNLNSSGTGSFKAALEASGTRTVVFTVGGTIDMNGGIIDIYNGNLTIAGETAPGDGILIKDGSIAVYASNVIVRHLRIRGSANEAYQFRIKGSGSLYGFGLENIILDHCSFSWANDQTISVAKAKNVTIQNSLITGSVKSILAWANKDLSVLNNIMALVTSRNIESNQQLGTYLLFEEINNLVYGTNWVMGLGKGIMGTVENNIFEGSNSFSQASSYPISYTEINPNYIGNTNIADLTYVYENGNIIDGSYSGVYDTSYPSYIKESPLYRSTYTPKPIAGLKDNLLSNAGAFPWNRDSVDELVIAHINAKTGTVALSGTYPTINGGTPYTDSDGDGMSDDWESANNLNPNDGSDGREDRNGDGYTNLEEFLYYLRQ